VCGAWMGEEGKDVGSGHGFLAWSYGVFEVVGYGVNGKSAGLFEKFGGGGGDWKVLVELGWMCREGYRIGELVGGRKLLWKTFSIN
jgi:hypothetical protein